MSRYIQKLISEGEHMRQDFKFEITDSRKIARTLAAFANTRGGRILIGVKDNGNISGISSDEEYHMIEAAAQMYCRPEITFESRKWHIQGKTVLEVIIPESDRKPVTAQLGEGSWKAFIRIHDENKLAGSVQVSVWKKERRKKGVYFPYDAEKKILLEYLSANRAISQSAYCRIARINRKEAVEILSDLVVLGVIQIQYREDAWLYSLVPGPNLPEPPVSHEA